MDDDMDDLDAPNGFGCARSRGSKMRSDRFFRSSNSPSSSTSSSSSFRIFPLFVVLVLCAMTLPACNAYWPTLQGNSARQGRMAFPFLRVPPPDGMKWMVDLQSPNYLNRTANYTFGTPAVDSRGLIYVTYATNSSPFLSGVISIRPNGTKIWIAPIDTSSGRSARGSVTLSEDESLLYFVASNPSGSAMFYALNTSVGSQVWSYTASFPLQGIADPVVYKTAVIMGDSRQLYYFPDGTRSFVGWRFDYSAKVCGTGNVQRVTPSISLYNADVILACEKKYIMSIFIDDATLKWSTSLVCNNTAGCDMTGNAVSIGDDGTIFVTALDNYIINVEVFNDTTNDTIIQPTEWNEFLLFTINPGGSVRNRLTLNQGPSNTGMWQIPAIGSSNRVVYVGGYQPEAYVWRVDITTQQFTSITSLNGNASSPPIVTTGARGYIVDSSSTLYAFNGANVSNTWLKQYGDEHALSSLAFGSDGTIYMSDSTSGGLFAYGCPFTTQIGPDGSCIPCPPGTYFLTDGRSLCPPCPAGRVSSGGGSLSSCTSCPAGSIPSPDKTQCVVCPSGTRPNFDLASCTSGSATGSANPSRGSSIVLAALRHLRATLAYCIPAPF